MTGIGKVKRIVLIAAILACLVSAGRRLLYIYQNYDLQGLINHEKNHR